MVYNHKYVGFLPHISAGQLRSICAGLGSRSAYVAAQLQEHTRRALRQEWFCSPKITGQFLEIFLLSRVGERVQKLRVLLDIPQCSGYPHNENFIPNVKRTEVEKP